MGGQEESGMKDVSWCVGVVLVGVAALTSAQVPPLVDTSSWKVLREEALGFQLKHPPTWRVGRSTGTLESVLLREPEEAGPARVSMQVFVQRGINPQGLAIEQWYLDQLRRLKVAAPPPTTRTVIGGRPTIVRRLSGPDGPRYDYYAAVNASDVLQVSITQSTPEARLDRTHEAVLSSITLVK
jgi:hypothetical protein